MSKHTESREDHYYTSNEDMRHFDSNEQDDSRQQLPPLDAQASEVSEMQVGSRQPSAKSQRPKTYNSKAGYQQDDPQENPSRQTSAKSQRRKSYNSRAGYEQDEPLENPSRPTSAKSQGPKSYNSRASYQQDDEPLENPSRPISAKSQGPKSYNSKADYQQDDPLENPSRQPSAKSRPKSYNREDTYLEENSCESDESPPASRGKSAKRARRPRSRDDYAEPDPRNFYSEGESQRPPSRKGNNSRPRSNRHPRECRDESDDNDDRPRSARGSYQNDEREDYYSRPRSNIGPRQNPRCEDNEDRPRSVRGPRQNDQYDDFEDRPRSVRGPRQRDQGPRQRDQYDPQPPRSRKLRRCSDEDRRGSSGNTRRRKSREQITGESYEPLASSNFPEKNRGIPPDGAARPRSKSREPNDQRENYIPAPPPRQEMGVSRGPPRNNGYHTGAARAPDPTMNCDYVDPNSLSPTYSMVSYCPIIGKCGLFPLNMFDQMRALIDGAASPPGCCNGPPVVMPQCFPVQKMPHQCCENFQESKYCQTEAMQYYANNNPGQYPGMQTTQQTGHGVAQTQANEFDTILPPPGYPRKDVVVYSRESQSRMDLPAAKMAVTEIPYVPEQQPHAQNYAQQQAAVQNCCAQQQLQAQHCCAQQHAAQHFCAQQYQYQAQHCCVQQQTTGVQKQNMVESQDGKNGAQLPAPKIAVTELPYAPQPEPYSDAGVPPSMAETVNEDLHKEIPADEEQNAVLAEPALAETQRQPSSPAVAKQPSVVAQPSTLTVAKQPSVAAQPSSPALAKQPSVVAESPSPEVAKQPSVVAKASSIVAQPPPPSSEKASSIVAQPAAKLSSAEASPREKPSSVAKVSLVEAESPSPAVAKQPSVAKASSISAQPPPPQSKRASSIVAAPPIEKPAVAPPSGEKTRGSSAGAGQSPLIQTETLKAPAKSRQSKAEKPLSDTSKTVKNDNLDSNRVRGADKEDDDSLFALRKVENKNVNLNVLKAESKVTFQDKRTIAEGISGLRLYAESKQTLADEEKDFIDYFVEYEGVKYIRILEQMYGTYKDKVQGVLKLGSEPESKRKFEQAHIRIAEFYKIIEVDIEKQLQEYDFPTVLENDTDKFRIDSGTKIAAVGKLHNYGVKMVLYWLRLLETKSKPVDPQKIYQVATELMAEIMVLCYSLFVRIAEFLTRMADDATTDEVKAFTLEHLAHAFRNLVDCICDEMGAIGESCGQVMIRIPSLSREQVVNTMTKLYTQINYADVSISRAIESMTPIIHMYYLRYFIEKKQPTRATR